MADKRDYDEAVEALRKAICALPRVLAERRRGNVPLGCVVIDDGT